MNVSAEKVNKVLWDVHAESLKDVEDEDWNLMPMKEVANDRSILTGRMYVTYYLVAVGRDLIYLTYKKDINEEGTGTTMAMFKWGSVTPCVLTQVIKAMIDDSYEMIRWPMLN